jgi:hypothetical protein
MRGERWLLMIIIVFRKHATAAINFAEGTDDLTREGEMRAHLMKLQAQASQISFFAKK